MTVSRAELVSRLARLRTSMGVVSLHHRGSAVVVSLAGAFEPRAWERLAFGLSAAADDVAVTVVDVSGVAMTETSAAKLGRALGTAVGQDLRVVSAHVAHRSLLGRATCGRPVYPSVGAALAGVEEAPAASPDEVIGALALRVAG